jgi:hypothetical protein
MGMDFVLHYLSSLSFLFTISHPILTVLHPGLITSFPFQRESRDRDRYEEDDRRERAELEARRDATARAHQETERAREEARRRKLGNRGQWDQEKLERNDDRKSSRSVSRDVDEVKAVE